MNKVSIHFVFYVIGQMLCVLALAMVVCTAFEDGFSYNAKAFIESAAITAFIGAALVFSQNAGKIKFDVKAGYLLTALS